MNNSVLKVRRKGLSFQKEISVQTPLNKGVEKTDNNDRSIVAREMEKSSTQGNIKETRKGVFKKTPVLLRQKKPLFRDGLVAYLINSGLLGFYSKLSPDKIKLVSMYFNSSYSEFVKEIRVYDVTDIVFDGSNAPVVKKLELHEGLQKRRIVRNLRQGRSYCFELGIKLNGGKFFPLLRSNMIKVPRTTSDQVDEEKGEFKPVPTSQQWVDHVSTYTYYDPANDGWKLS